MRAALVMVLLALVGYALADVIPGSGARLWHASLAWVLGAGAAEAAALVCYSVLFWGVFSDREHRVPLGRSSQIALGELGAYAVVPTGVGGPVLRVWALLAGGMPFDAMVVRSVVHAIIFNLPYVVVAIALGLGVLFGVGSGHAPVLVALAPLGLVLVAGAGAAAFTVSSRQYRGLAAGGWRGLWLRTVRAIPDGLRATPAALRRPLLLASATGYWAGDLGALVLAFHAVHGSPSVMVIMLAYMLGQLGNALPLPGGVGGVEPLMLGVLTASGVGLGVGAAAIVLYRVISLGMQALAGTVSVIALGAALRGASPVPALEQA